MNKLITLNSKMKCCNSGLEPPSSFLFSPYLCGLINSLKVTIFL
jgi:hypothetical protein